MQGGQFGAGDGQRPADLDVSPGVGVGAPVRPVRRSPGFGPPVALGPVGRGRHGHQVSRVGLVVGVAAFGGSVPRPTAAAVGVGQRDEVVDVQGAGVVHGGPCEGGQPPTAGHQAAVVPQHRRGSGFGHQHLVPGVQAVAVIVRPAPAPVVAVVAPGSRGVLHDQQVEHRPGPAGVWRFPGGRRRCAGRGGCAGRRCGGRGVGVLAARGAPGAQQCGEGQRGGSRTPGEVRHRPILAGPEANKCLRGG